MNAVILAGGIRYGNEVRGLGLPRSLWPFPNQPLIAHVLAFLVRAGARRIAICGNGTTRVIASRLAPYADESVELHYSEEIRPRGPAGCLHSLQGWLGDTAFIVIQATASYDFDISAMLKEHGRMSAAVTVGARPSYHSNVLEPVGVYIVEPSTLPLIPASGFQDLKEQFIFKVIAAGGVVRPHLLCGRATLIHSAADYLSAISAAIFYAAERLPSEFVQQSPGVIIHQTALVQPSSRLRAPVWIGPAAIVEEGAVLAGPVVMGANSRVGAGAIVHRAVLLHNSSIATGVIINSTIMPANVTRTVLAARKILESSHPWCQAETPTLPHRTLAYRMFASLVSPTQNPG